jgi:hypothetical protein
MATSPAARCRLLIGRRNRQRWRMSVSDSSIWCGTPHDSDEGSNREICARVALADETPAGQFEFYCCSTRCLREFLNASVDALENKIIREFPRRVQRNDRLGSARASRAGFGAFAETNF